MACTLHLSRLGPGHIGRLHRRQSVVVDFALPPACNCVEKIQLKRCTHKKGVSEDKRSCRTQSPAV